MDPPSVRLPGKLPHVGTTIFTVMSRLAAEQGALNLIIVYPPFRSTIFTRFSMLPAS